MYVSLEPCSHYGKTPPCAQLIIESKIPKVVVAVKDPHVKVAGRGIEMLREANIEVTVGVLEQEAKELNKEFFTFQSLRRPYIYLKWAQTRDGFIDNLRVIGEPAQPTIISNSFALMNVHKLRAEVNAIFIGTNTAINDNPSLTVRCWHGKNPIRIVLDRQGRIPSGYKIFDNSVDTIIFTERVTGETISGRTRYIPLSFNQDMFTQLMDVLNRLQINSMLVEGGRITLQNFIDAGLWDEAFIEVANKKFGAGLPAPIIKGNDLDIKIMNDHKQIHILRE